MLWFVHIQGVACIEGKLYSRILENFVLLVLQRMITCNIDSIIISHLFHFDYLGIHGSYGSPPIPPVPPYKELEEADLPNDHVACATGILFLSNSTSHHLMEISAKYSEDFKLSVLSLISKFGFQPKTSDVEIKPYEVEPIWQVWHLPFTKKQDRSQSNSSNITVIDDSYFVFLLLWLTFLYSLVHSQQWRRVELVEETCRADEFVRSQRTAATPGSLHRQSTGCIEGGRSILYSQVSYKNALNYALYFQLHSRIVSQLSNEQTNIRSIHFSCKNVWNFHISQKKQNNKVVGNTILSSFSVVNVTNIYISI